MKIALSKNFHSLDKCFFYEILDSEMYEKRLRWLNIPLSEGEIFKISYAVLAIFCLVLFLRSKFFK